MKNPLRPFTRAAALTLGMALTAGLNAAEPLPAAVQDLVTRPGTRWSVELRDTFLQQAREEVLRKAEDVSAETITWVDEHPLARQAVYGAVYPPDPRILSNLDQLRSELGPELFDKYRQFCLAAAVARRKLGVGPIANAAANLKFATLYGWADQAEAAGQSPAEALATRPAKVPAAEAGPEATAFAAVKAYLEEHSLAADDAYADEQHLGAMTSLLETAGIKKPDRALPGMLQRWMLENEQRPAERSSYPSVAEFLRYLDKIHAIPASQLSLDDGQRWPMYPLEQSPWPMLMPLSMTWPLDEAQYIWEKFQGEHGEKRLHTCGPYRRFPLGVPPALEESEWHWQAWPSVITTGGLCGTMSSIANGTYTSLGVPILKAGQPGHSCIVRYDVNPQGEYSAGIGQSATGGPDKTTAAWLFADGPVPGSRGTYSVGSVYHFGLAQGMNLGLASYMDTRIAVHIYKALPESQRYELGVNLVKNTLVENPCNLEAWYLLGRDARSADDLLPVIDGFERLLDADAVMEQQKERDATVDLGEDKIDRSAGLGPKIATIRQVGMKEMLSLALQDLDRFPVEDLERIAGRLDQSVANGDEHLMALRDRCRFKVAGAESMQAGIAGELQRYLDNPPKGRKATRIASSNLLERIELIGAMTEDRAQREAWLKSLLDGFSPDQKVSVSKTDERQLTKFYGQVSDLLMKSLKSKPANKTGLKELQTLHAALLNPQAGDTPEG